MLFFFFFFNDTATTEIYTLSLHDALPISSSSLVYLNPMDFILRVCMLIAPSKTVLLSSVSIISYVKTLQYGYK